MRFAISFVLLLCLQIPASAQFDFSIVEARRVASGFASPVGIVSARDGSGRLFIVEQAGRIWILDRTHNRLPTPFLDIRGRVQSGGEQGLLGLAFPPDFAESQVFFVNYTNPDTVIARFRVSAADPDRADAGSESVYLTEPQPFGNHNGGDMHFGPDGYLYATMGDGGSGGDPGDRAQSLSTRLGKMLRLDVSGDAPALAPESNPFVGTAGARAEIWSYGLRNPWRFSFDRATGDMFIGDVGQQRREEITFEPAGVGGLNHGWRLMEGSLCFIPANGCNDGTLTLPILDYGHTGGRCSVTGGYVYRGAAYPQLNGVYFFADFCSGGVYGGVRTNGSWRMVGPMPMGFSISTFGEDEAGEIYFANIGGGEIYRIEADSSAPMISSGGVLNAASLRPGPVAAGSIVSVFGAGFSGEDVAAEELPLPTSLGGASLSFGGVPAELFFVSPGQANLLVPAALEGLASAELVPSRDGVSGPPAEVGLAEFAPGIFAMNQSGDGQGAVLIAGAGLLAAPTADFRGARPASKGESLEIYATGLGRVETHDGRWFSVRLTAETPVVTLGGVEVPVTYSGPAPGFAGLYQVNVELTPEVPSGPAVPLRLTQGGIDSNKVTVAIE